MKNKTKIKINFIVTILLLLVMNLNYVLAAAGPVEPQIPQIINPIASIEVVGDHFTDKLTFTVNLQDVRPLTQCAYSLNFKYINDNKNIELFSERISSNGTYSYDSSFNLNMYSLTFTKTIDISALESGIVDMYLVVVNNTGISKPHCNQAIHINEGDENNTSILQSKIVQAQKLYDISTEGINIGQYITGSKIKLQAAIDHAQEVVNDINVTEANILNAIAKLDSDVADFNSLLIDDMTALQIALVQAIDLYDNSTEGIESGQYKVGSRLKLYTSITHTQQIVNNISSTGPEKINALTELKNAINDFKSSIVKEYIGSKRYDINFQDTGVLELQLKNIPKFCNYDIEVYNGNNVLLRKAENLDSTNKKIMCDIPVAGNYYAKVYYKNGFSEAQTYELQLNRKEKFELIQGKLEDGYISLNLKINNPKNIRTGTIVLEYDPAIIKDPESDDSYTIFNSSLDVVCKPTGLKTVAVKNIIGETKNKVVFFYDMENDRAKDMADQNVIIDTINFKVLKQAVTIISILPDSTISWYDSNSYISNKQISMTINTQMSSTSAIAETVDNNPKLEILQDSLKQLENQKDIYNPEVSLNPAYSGDINSFPGLIDNTSNSSIFGNVRVPAGSHIKSEQLIVTLRNGLNEKRSVYPNNIGRFSFQNVPAGDYYVKVERNDDLLNIPTKKPMIVTNEKHIGSVNGDNCLFVQELGYYYDADYNNDGHMNETDVTQFMDEAKNYNVIIGNVLNAPPSDNENKMLNATLLSTSISSNIQMPNTSIMPYTNETEQYDTSSDGIINSNDISNTITGDTWNDPKNPGLVDRHNYDAYSIGDTIPDTFKAGDVWTFTISFKDISQKYSEDVLYLALDAMGLRYKSDSGDIPYEYYFLDRLDANQIKTTIIKHEITEFTSIYTPNNVIFTVKYEVPENIDNESINLTFRLKHYADFTFGKPLSKNVSISNPNPSPQKPDWYRITTTDNYGKNVEICLSDIGGSGGEKNIITAMIRWENESLWSTYQVIHAGGTYAWVDTGSTYASPPSKNGYEAVRIAEIPSIHDILDSIDKKKIVFILK